VSGPATRPVSTTLSTETFVIKDAYSAAIVPLMALPAIGIMYTTNKHATAANSVEQLSLLLM